MHAALDVVDNATVAQRRDDPSAYDIYVTYIFPIRDPAVFPQWDATSYGWWVNTRKDALLQELASEPDDGKRLDLQSQFQELWYADVPMLRIGDVFDLRIASKNAHGPGLSSPLLYLYNCWLSK
jgi:peptide/nickel transport system substrate-binding protein